MTTNSHYFFAIPLPSEIKKRLYEKQQKLKEQKSIAYHNWTNFEDFHITLTFLGHMNEEVKEKLIKSIEELRLAPFELSIGKLGWFGLNSRPRVLWIGVEKSPSLRMLQKQIANIAEQNGFKQDRRAYLPHITLAKKWHTGKIEEKQLEQFQTMISEQWMVKVDHFVLYKINPNLTPRYQIVSKFKL
ncbi:RNA 2',3'-cyclic phosphodiesterase [Paraliobacillus sediminis]|uniref:RNA 2',3'-cyclic phosphodiesterase n=1 Tax=Paraliobacillus sediminis TaxID=1885916 RepID=UPI000E3C9AB5|nr:RNA 2',3'-cyclic phosphodiesterase [Paraliobacillus sediminis]